ncbi:hypothetical protein TNCV_5003361 [Trichonephila clavipes]|nr:hypothetical protein TNCV_5003361 [Trichonephila clavipes]
MPTERSQARCSNTFVTARGAHRPSEERLQRKTLSNGLKEFLGEAFKNGLSGLFGDRQKYQKGRRTTKMPRAQRSGEEYTVLHTKCIVGLCQGGKITSDERRRKSATPNESVSTKPTKLDTTNIRRCNQEIQSSCSEISPEPRKTNVWRTADNRPVCFHCGRPGHVMRYCRERLSLALSRRRNFDDVGTEEEIRRPSSSRPADVILGWDFLEASQAVIDCGQNELVLETSVETPQRLTPGICMPPGTIH